MEENKTQKQIIYTNSIGVEASVFDVKLKLNYLTSSEKEEVIKNDLCEVVMSPQHAKAFSKVLMNTIKSYEEQFGEIELNAAKKEG